MDAQFMTLRCDHCREQLGPIVQRYWRMRFCSEACKAAYQGRLGESTRHKIGRLDRLECDALQPNGHRVGSRPLTGIGQRFAA
jgi:hypothetical protein